MEATFFRKHRNQRNRCFITRIFSLAQATQAAQRYFHRTAAVVQMAPHLSKFELALVRQWQSAAQTAKELWELHKADRTRRCIKPVCFSAFKKLLNGTTHRGEPETRGRKRKLGPRAVRALDEFWPKGTCRRWGTIRFFRNKKFIGGGNLRPPHTRGQI